MAADTNSFISVLLFDYFSTLSWALHITNKLEF